MIVKPIPTTYKGIQFRSRLEARWAVFFDSLSIEWKYEYEGYQLPSGWYLPDFWLPVLDTWVEIKGVEPNEEEQQKAHELCDMTRKRIVIMVGLGPFEYGNGSDGGYQYSYENEIVSPEQGHIGWDCQYWPTICPECGVFGIEFNGRSERVKHTHGCGYTVADKCYNSEDERIVNALANAVRYQFRYPGDGR